LIRNTAAKPTAAAGPALPLPKARANALIDPIGPRTMVPRDHELKVTLELSGRDARHADKREASELVRRSLDAFAPAPGDLDRRSFADVSSSTKDRKTGTVSSVVVGVEGSVVWPGRPSAVSVSDLRAALLAADYVVAVRERRECAEGACTSSAVVDWSAGTGIPSGWFSAATCGKHDYRSCPKCKSVYRLTSANAAGQAASVKCEVCGWVLVEWGGSKIWEAELVTRVEPLG